MSDKAQNVDELKSLKRIEDLLTVLARAALADRIDEIMNDKSHRVVLELTGKMTVRQLAKKTGLSPMTISASGRSGRRSDCLRKTASSIEEYCEVPEGAEL